MQRNVSGVQVLFKSWLTVFEEVHIFVHETSNTENVRPIVLALFSVDFFLNLPIFDFFFIERICVAVISRFFLLASRSWIFHFSATQSAEEPGEDSLGAKTEIAYWFVDQFEVDAKTNRYVLKYHDFRFALIFKICLS